MLHEAVTSKNQTFRKNLVNKEKPAGTIVIVADESKSSSEWTEFQMCLSLAKRLSEKQQAFFIISRGTIPG
jgi:hypothetical protein